MNLCNINHSFGYETEKLSRLFLPNEKINILDRVEPADIYAVTEIKEGAAVSELHIGDKTASAIERITEGETPANSPEELAIAVSLYNCFCELFEFALSWGILTGVRPAKLFSSLKRRYGADKAKEYFSEQLKVSDKKISLCEATAETESKIVEKSTADSFSLYVSIPFCPSRCSYCSFVSHSVEKAKKLIPEYLEKLKTELTATAQIAKNNRLALKSVYIGGGTPTSLTTEQISDLMAHIKANFDLSGILEYTVEAGRPDTLDCEKLTAILEGGATRISINPQTLNDAVLEKIGRRHTAEQAISAFKLAREVGFDNINMDLIAGLPGDTLESFKKTVDEIIALYPENVTVHSLSLKRAADLNRGEPDMSDGIVADKMVDYARERLSKAGITPYYMYRQSKTVGNLENVGYARLGYEGVYNVYIMDETHSILACGASAVTKLREPGGSRIERIFNFKYPYEYIEGIDTLIERKNGINEFYGKYPLEN